MGSDSNLKGWLWAGCVTALLGVCFWDTFAWMLVHRWFHGDGLYEHAPILVAFGLWVLWRDRKALGGIPRRPAVGGLILLFAGLLVHLFAVLIYRDSLSGFALLPILVGLLLVSGGKQFALRLLPVACLLLFIVPLPDQLLKLVTFPLKMASTGTGSALAGLFLGDDMVREGTRIYLAGQAQPLVVGDACSGMRSAIALSTIGYCLAFFFGGRGGRRIGLLLLALPVAFLANSLRIALLILVGHLWGVAAATGAAHDILGYGVYFIAIGLLLLVDRVGQRLPGWRQEGRV